MRDQFAGYSDRSALDIDVDITDILYGQGPNVGSQSDLQIYTS